nr:MAG TPA: hypothetical protein [Caudoviricetes sp.]
MLIFKSVADDFGHVELLKILLLKSTLQFFVCFVYNFYQKLFRQKA